MAGRFSFAQWWGKNISKATKWIAGIGLLLAAVVGVIENLDKIKVLLFGEKPPSVAQVEVLPTKQLIHVGEALKLAVNLKDAHGNALFGRPVSWSSSRPEIAAITASGIVNGAAVGTATVTAKSEDQTGEAIIDVSLKKVKALIIFPPHKTIRKGATLQLEATPKDDDGNSVSDHPVDWSSEDESIATVTATGLVAGVSAGKVDITARSDAQTQTAHIAVAPEPPTTGNTDPSGGGGPAPTSATPAAGGKVLSSKTVMMTKIPVMIAQPSVAVLASVRALPRITLLNARGMPQCGGKLRILIGDTLVEPSTDREDVVLSAAGPTNYTVGGRLECPGTGSINLSGSGSANISMGKSYSVSVKLRAPHDATVRLTEQ